MKRLRVLSVFFACISLSYARVLHQEQTPVEVAVLSPPPAPILEEAAAIATLPPPPSPPFPEPPPPPPSPNPPPPVVVETKDIEQPLVSPAPQAPVHTVTFAELVAQSKANPNHTGYSPVFVQYVMLMVYFLSVVVGLTFLTTVWRYLRASRSKQG
jgi:hypothetical protein